MPTLNITVDLPNAGILDMEDLKQRVTAYANSLVAQHRAAWLNEEQAGSVYISDRIKALETGFECKGHVSDDYKTEIEERKAGRYT